jgi:lysyl-tRNA synthetase class 2
MSESNTTQFDSSLIGQRQLRLDKVKQLRNMGIDPFPSKSARTKTNAEVVDNFAEYENKDVVLAGRLMSWREHGALIFGNIQDQTGKIQIYIKSDEINPTDISKQNLGFENLSLVDVGDIVEVSGTITRTNRGEISILVKDFKILTKAIRPIPTELEDKEDRFRRRYLDMTLHPEVRQRFERRSKFWQATRDFLNQRGFVEVNIPVLEHTTGGADAKPFVTHYDALNQNFYLRISHELPLKRLLGAGFEKVYDIGPRFRNEGFSDEHLPEHIAVEWYWAYADYREGMKLTQELFRYVMQEVYGTLQFTIKGFDVDLSKEWEEVWFADIIKERFGIDIFTDSVEKMNEKLKENSVDLGTDINRNRVIDNLWKVIRKTIGGPAFLLGVPKFMSPLSKANVENPELVDRFQPLIGGSELANAWSELNDPVDQLDRFKEQQNMRDAGDEEAQMLDIDFVEMLEYGMPPAVGYGHSERVFWFFENVTAKEGVPFPQLKADIDNVTKDIYPELKLEVEVPELEK